MSIDAKQRDTLRHMLGLDLKYVTTAWRNYYSCPQTDEHLNEMERAGLVYWAEIPWNGDGGVWVAYRHAAEAVLEPGQSLSKDTYYRAAPKEKDQ